jgi:hypothetical protein
VSSLPTNRDEKPEPPLLQLLIAALLLWLGLGILFGLAVYWYW